MREFIYKTFIVIVGVFFLYQFTIGYTISKLEQKIYSIDVKEYSTFLKNKIRDELKSGLKKDFILNKEDAIILKNFLDKINKELKNQ